MQATRRKIPAVASLSWLSAIKQPNNNTLIDPGSCRGNESRLGDVIDRKTLKKIKNPQKPEWMHESATAHTYTNKNNNNNKLFIVNSTNSRH